jgi:hypothetical protein
MSRFSKTGPVGLDEFTDREAILGFLGEMLTCLLMSWSHC